MSLELPLIVDYVVTDAEGTTDLLIEAVVGLHDARPVVVSLSLASRRGQARLLCPGSRSMVAGRRRVTPS